MIRRDEIASVIRCFLLNYLKTNFYCAASHGVITTGAGAASQSTQCIVKLFQQVCSYLARSHGQDWAREQCFIAVRNSYRALAFEGRSTITRTLRPVIVK